MSTAKPGNGQLRSEILRLGREAQPIMSDLFDLVFLNEGTTRNNLDTPSSEELLGIMNKVRAQTDELLEVFKKAWEHHNSQTSVLPNNIFGQRRRKNKEGVVSTVDPIDTNKLSTRLKTDNFSNLTPQQQTVYMTRGMNPDSNFGSWDSAKQLQYLIGAYTPT